jgi:hypothetical protein
MGYLRTKLATDWEKEAPGTLMKLIRIFFRDPNPDYRLHLVHSWLVEFDDDGNPRREVGVGQNGEPVLAGPDERNYGFWLDTNMTRRDFTGDEITREEFEEQWNRWYSRFPQEAT